MSRTYARLSIDVLDIWQPSIYTHYPIRVLTGFAHHILARDPNSPRRMNARIGCWPTINRDGDWS
jgi:hypothetical protein